MEKVKAEVQQQIDDMKRDLRKSVLESAERKIKEELEQFKSFTTGRLDRVNKRIEAVGAQVEEKAHECDRNTNKTKEDFAKLKKA